MKELFKLSPEELSKVCLEAEFDEKRQLIIQPSNLIREGNIVLLKRPIRIRYGTLQTSTLGKTTIVKEDVDCSFLYLLALADTKQHRETLRNYYETNHCDEYDCIGLNSYYEGWSEDNDLPALNVRN